MTDGEWVRAAEASRMLGISRERVRQLIEAGVLVSKREPKRVVLVSVESINQRLGKTGA